MKPRESGWIQPIYNEISTWCQRDMRLQNVAAWLPPFLSTTRMGDSLAPPPSRVLSSSTLHNLGQFFTNVSKFDAMWVIYRILPFSVVFVTCLMRSKTVERGEHCWGQLQHCTTVTSFTIVPDSRRSLIVLVKKGMKKLYNID